MQAAGRTTASVMRVNETRQQETEESQEVRPHI